jgi:hypothetical protein
VPGAELVNDREDGVLFGLVPLETADLEREALPVDPDAVRTRRTQATSRVYEPD